MKHVFIVNPLSETVARKGSILRSMLDIADPSSDLAKITIFEIDFSDSIEPVIDLTIQNSIEHVFIEGGDGTAHGILTAFFRRKSEFSTYPKFTLLRGGMTNQVAKTIGLKNRKPKTINKAVQQDGTQASRVPMLKIQSEGYPDSYGFLFSTGAVPMITDYTKDTVHKKGIGGSAAVAAGILKGISGKADDVMSRTEIDLEIKGSNQTRLSENHLGTLVTTLPSLIMGLDPFWGTEDGPLRITFAGENTRRLYKHIPSLWLGRKTISREQDGLKSHNATALHYRYNGPIVLDGETLDFQGQDFMITATDPIEFVY